MKQVILTLLILTFFVGCIERIDRNKSRFDRQQVVAACDQVIGDFQSRLSDELYTALSNGGPAAAIAVCNVKAPVIADKYSQLPGIDIRRVSLRMRNPHIVPDHFEDSVLQAFAAHSADTPDVAAVLVKDSGEVAEFRYMKEILTGQLCLNCHGNPDNFTPELTETLARLYPHDKAVGYDIGESRGAFSIRVKYPEAKETITRLLSENGR